MAAEVAAPLDDLHESNLSPDQLDEMAKELLEADPEASAQLRRYEEALTRVARAQAAKAELDKLFQEAAEAALSTETEEQLQKQQAGEIMAAAEEKAAKKLVEAAELEYTMAQVDQSKWADAIVEDLERTESGKAAAVALAGGVLGSIPLVLADASSTPSLVLTVAVTAATCLLFGVTYRYAVRRDAGNVHLRAGVVAAFGLAKGLAGASVMEQVAMSAGQSPLALEVVGPAALYAGQSMLVVAFAAAALEAAFQSKLVKRFGEISSS